MGNLLQPLNEWINPNERKALAAHLNVDADKIDQAFQGLYPMLLSGILQAGPTVRNQIQEWMRPDADERPGSESITAAFLRGESSLTQRQGQALLQLIFPHQKTALINILSNHAGLAPEHCSTLLDLSCAALTAYVQQPQLREQMPRGLFAWLSTQREAIETALPAAYVSMITAEEIRPGTDTGKNRMMPVLLLCLLGIGIWYWVKGCQVESAHVAQPSAVQSDSVAHHAPDSNP